MRLRSVLFALATAGLACQCGETTKPTDAGAGCARVDALLDSRVACRQDDQCPCGAYCARGVCAFDCRADRDCDGGWCDPTGHCRDAADHAAVRAVGSVSEVAFTVFPAQLPVLDRSAELTVSVEGAQRALGEVRLEASAGLLVRCREAWATECTTAGPAAGQRLLVKLRLDPAGQPTAWRLRVFHGQQMKTVSLAPMTAPLAGPLRSGSYRGTLWAEATTMTLAGNLPATPQRFGDSQPILDVPLDARLFDDGTLVLSDRRKLFPTWKFSVRPDGTFGVTGGADPSRRVLVGRATSPADPTATEVTVDAVGALTMVGEGELTGTLETFFGGLGLGGPAAGLAGPRVRWGLSLTRQGALLASDTPSSWPTTEAVPAFAADDERAADRLPWESVLAGTTVTGPSLFPTWQERLQYFLCYRRDVGVATAPTALPFGTTPQTPLRDYACAEPAPATGTMIYAFPFFSLDRTVTAAALLQTCLGDLAKTAATPPTQTCGASDINCRTGDTTPRGCVDPPLVLRALGMGLDLLERQGATDRWYESRSDPALRNAHRLLAQWLQLHTFVAREATQVNDPGFEAPQLDLPSALGRSLDGWNVLLHPKVASRLAHWPAPLLREPDYRTGQTSMSLDNAQPIGVPVMMLEALAAQVDAARQLVSETRHTVRAQVPAEVPRALRAVVVVLPLARALHARAITGTPPPWEAYWVEAERRLRDAVTGLNEEWLGLERGANPLGIEEPDLPLYHSGADVPDAIARFKATSNYLLASGGGATDPGWATRAVADAVTSSNAARAQWEKLLERKLQSSLAQQARDDRVAQLEQNYGEKILTLCGEKMFPTAVPAAGVLTALSQQPKLNAYTCFMNQQDSACRYDEAELLAKLTPDDLALRLCVLGALQQQYQAKVEFKDDYANDFVEQASAAVGPAARGAQLSADVTATLRTVAEAAIDAVRQEPWQASGLVSDQSLTLRTENPSDLEQAETLCRGLFPSAVPMNKRVASLASSPLDRPECYAGSMGELALAVRAAAKDIEIASARFQELTDSYTIALNHCLTQESALRQRQDVLDKAAEVTRKVEQLQAVSDGIFRVFDGVLGCVTGSGIDTLTGCANSLLTVYKDAAQGFINNTLSTEGVTALSAQFLTSIQNDMTNALCFNDAQMHLVGADTQARQLEKARLDLSLAMVKLRNAQATFPRLVAEGRARVAAERERSQTSLADDTWKDLYDLELASQKGVVERARRDLHIARRATYLAVRAVEYEWQLSLSARADVLKARRPADLEAVLTQLRTTLAPNTISGQAPKNANVVLSLKEHILQLADRSGWPEGQQTWTGRERLGQLLTSPRQASFDSNGAWIGQLVRLPLAPLGVLGVGQTAGVPLLTGSDCAERLWKVNLVLQGTNLVGNGTTKTRVDLLQKNVFHSQWCSRQAAGVSPLQSLSVRPSRNLFQDPVWGRVGGTASITGEADEFLRASIDAYHNVSRSDFERADYQQGASMELACRGLYGDFALFFPKELLAVDGHDGLRLENVEDVLLRLDYASVTKPRGTP